MHSQSSAKTLLPQARRNSSTYKNATPRWDARSQKQQTTSFKTEDWAFWHIFILLLHAPVINCFTSNKYLILLECFSGQSTVDYISFYLATTHKQSASLWIQLK